MLNWKKVFISKPYVPRGPIRRVQNCRARERKVEVILWLQCYRVLSYRVEKPVLKRPSHKDRARRLAESLKGEKWSNPT